MPPTHLNLKISGQTSERGIQNAGGDNWNNGGFLSVLNHSCFSPLFLSCDGVLWWASDLEQGRWVEIRDQENPGKFCFSVPSGRTRLGRILPTYSNYHHHGDCRQNSLASWLRQSKLSFLMQDSGFIWDLMQGVVLNEAVSVQLAYSMTLCDSLCPQVLIPIDHNSHCFCAVDCPGSLDSEVRWC